MKFLVSAMTLMLGVVLAAPCGAAPEKTHITIGVGGEALLYYLPLTIAERKGFFREEGLDVTIDDFAGGAPSLMAMIGGSTDATAGSYEHTIEMQAKGQDIRAVIELGRSPGIALVVRKSLAAEIRSVADLKRRKIGVTAPGSSTNFFVNALLAKEGLSPDDVSFIAVGGGAGAVAAMEQGEIDAMANVDPVISKLEGDNAVAMLVDSRTEEGVKAVYGGPVPAGVLYAREDFIAAHPETIQALVNALMKSLRWLATATPEDVAATVPQEYLFGDRDLYIRSVRNSLPTYSRDGLIGLDGMQSSFDILRRFSPDLNNSQIDLARTWEPRFAEVAAHGVH
jgi:NitT/TauT family transport system substrate-binding protein